MEFFETVEKRRSVRRFFDDVVPESVIEKCLRAATLAPSSSNLQPWEFVWVRSAEMKHNLAFACLSQPAAKTASDLIVAVARPDLVFRNIDIILEHFQKEPQKNKSVIEYYEKEVKRTFQFGFFGIPGIFRKIKRFGESLQKPVQLGPNSEMEMREILTKSVALACQNFLLATYAEGYASCPMEGFDERRVKTLLSLPIEAKVVMIIAVGKPNPDGIYGERYRFDSPLVIRKI